MDLNDSCHEEQAEQGWAKKPTLRLRIIVPPSMKRGQNKKQGTPVSANTLWDTPAAMPNKFFVLNEPHVKPVSCNTQRIDATSHDKATSRIENGRQSTPVSADN
jgi:hypothetical protein